MAIKASAPLDILKALYRTMVMSREVDLIEQEYTGRGEAVFHVSGAGHEASAALSPFLGPQDWLHCHYRDKALMMARGIAPQQFFLALFNKDASHSRGRQMNAHMSCPQLRILSLVGPVGNSALQAVGVANAVKGDADQPVVLCSLGDGMTQQGEVLEALAHAVRETLPVLFLVQDNKLAISTSTTAKTFYQTPAGDASEFYGIPIHRINGRYPQTCLETFATLVAAMRKDRSPAIVIMDVDRLHSHTNADDQRIYRSVGELEQVKESGDPIVNLEIWLKAQGVPEDFFAGLGDSLRADLKIQASLAQRSLEPSPTRTALKPLPPTLEDPSSEYRGSPSATGEDNLVMLEAIREVLRKRMSEDERITLFGEDLEDPKGDVFGLTKGLSTTFPGRVRNSPLAEATIVGVSIGEALAGRRPVACLQFADFLPIAYNQIVSELGSMHWRTDGGWEAPVIVMVTCGGYKPGLGPFHASSYEALAVHTPGVDVFMPSTAGDAAGLLNAAFESGRPTLFFYPKSCLNDRDNATSCDVEKQLIPLGRARTVRQGKDITLVGYGNTVKLCLQAAVALSSQGAEAEVIDLRTLQPWDRRTVAVSVEKTGRLVVVHEDNESAGMGAEIIAVMAETVARPFRVRRVARADTYVPCNFANQLEVLPSYKRILETAVEMLGGLVGWELPPTAPRGCFLVEAIGSSPSDESVTVARWLVKPGDMIGEGDYIGDLEADKAAVELRSPASGLLEEILVPEGTMVKVGTPVLKVKIGEGEEGFKPLTKENPGQPRISDLRLAPATPVAPLVSHRDSQGLVGIQAVTSVKGSRVVTNLEIAGMCPEWETDDIFKRIGIETRPWIADGETVLFLATAAAKKLLKQTGLTLADIDLILVSTGTPPAHTPSLAAMIQMNLNLDEADPILVPAYDFSSACSGYIFGLKQASDHLKLRQKDRVLLITAEVLSPQIDMADYGTAPVFADAATATLLVGSGRAGVMKLKVLETAIGTHGESGEILKLPADPGEKISMDGPKVYLGAVKYMPQALVDACRQLGMEPQNLDLVVPHQANQRIINALRQRMKLAEDQVYSNIGHSGNTSSSTIPLCLEELLPLATAGQKWGLTAFGGGFTFGGAVLEVV